MLQPRKFTMWVPLRTGGCARVTGELSPASQVGLAAGHRAAWEAVGTFLAACHQRGEALRAQRRTHPDS